MRFFTGLIVLTIICVSACKPASQETSTTDTNATQQMPAAASTAASQPSRSPEGAYADLHSIEMASMKDLWDNCTSLDIIFYETNFSLSQTDQAAIRTTLQYLLPSPVRHDPDCKPVGRITFWADGELRREADIYVGETCNYYIWMDGNTPKYINPLTPDGIQFFTKVLTQGHELVPGQGE